MKAHHVRRIFAWVIFVLGSGTFAWVALSFLIRLPIDDAKVHPELKPSEFKSDAWILLPEQDYFVLIRNSRQFSQEIVIPNVKLDHDVWYIDRGIADSPKIDLLRYPHTRRCLTRWSESRYVNTLDFDYSNLTRDPFVLTRQALIGRCQDLREWIEKVF